MAITRVLQLLSPVSAQISGRTCALLAEEDPMVNLRNLKGSRVTEQIKIKQQTNCGRRVNGFAVLKC